jgi:hypothetical protein
MPLKTKLLFAFGGIWFICYVFFPLWWLPITHPSKLLIASLFIIYFIVNLVLINSWIKNGFEQSVQTFPYPLKDTQGSKNTQKNLGINFFLIIILLVNFLCHLYPMFLPIPSMGDQHYHAYAPLAMLEGLNSLWRNHLGFSFSPFVPWTILLILISVIIYLRHNPQSFFFLPKFKWPILLFLILGSYLYVFAILHTGILEPLGRLTQHFHRYPPLGKIIYFIWYSLAGANEFSARLVSLVFLYAAAFYLYQLISLFKPKETAFISSILFIFFPLVFQYSHDVYLDSGGTFFVVITSFYFLRYTLSHYFLDLVLTGFFLGAGFLYHKDLALPILFVIIASSLIFKKVPFKTILLMSWVALIPVAPWMIIQRLFPQRNYTFIPDNFFSLNILTTQLKIAYSALTPIGFIVALSGITYLLISLIRKRDFFTTYILMWLGIYYFLVTGELGYYITRYMLTAYPVWAIGAGICLTGLSKIHQRLTYIGLGLLITYLALTNCVTRLCPLELKFLDLSYYDPTAEQIYLPYDKLIFYVKEHLPVGSKILAPMRCEPSHFYLSLNQMSDTYIWERKNFPALQNQTTENLYEFCRQNNFRYLVIPETTKTWLNDIIKPELAVALKTDDRFRNIKNFTLGKNALILYQIILD